jgi:hypothetical protein
MGQCFVIAGGCHVSTDDMYLLENSPGAETTKEGTKEGGGIQADWPDYRSILQCPYCQRSAKPPEGKTKSETKCLSYQLLMQRINNPGEEFLNGARNSKGKGYRAMTFRFLPRIFCIPCLDKYFEGYPMQWSQCSPSETLPMADKKFNVKDISELLGMRCTTDLSFNDLTNLWEPSGLYDAFSHEIGELIMNRFGSRKSSSLSSINAGQIVSTPMKFCYNRKCTEKPADLINKLFKCARCTKVYYCSRQCQSDDWHRHKAVCAPRAIPAIKSTGS